MKLKQLCCAAVLLLLTTGPALAADTLSDFFARSQFSGEARAFYFTRDYSTPSKVNADAFALAGIFNVHTADFLGGFSVDAGFFTAHSLGTRSSDPAKIDTTLIGPGHSINALGEAYVQYHGHDLLFRLGNQLIKTPWANASDARVLPATYQAAYGEWKPLSGVSLSALRIFRYKGRTASDFDRDNNYYPATYAGDGNYGGISNLPANTPPANGALAFGAAYKARGVDANLWYYDFYDFAHMAYGDAAYTLDTGTTVKPYAGAQVVREWGSRNAYASTGTSYFGQPGSGVDSTTYGGIVGIKGYGASLSLGYDRIDPQGAGALGGGVLISPYTASYVTDPLYTSSMIRGLVELGPGTAWKIKATEEAFDKRLKLALSFARYRTYYSGNDNETYFDVTYAPHGRLKGLSLRDRLEIGNGNVNPGKRIFIYNRVQVVYKF